MITLGNCELHHIEGAEGLYLSPAGVLSLFVWAMNEENSFVGNSGKSALCMAHDGDGTPH